MSRFDSSKIWELTKENLLLRTSHSEILQYYTGVRLVKEKILCPFHKEKSPSMYIDLNMGYKCFGCGRSGDSIQFVMTKYSLTFPEALQVIANDLGLISLNPKKIPLEVLGLAKKDEISPTIIKIKERDWEKEDIKYWKQYNISKELCIEYNVYPISHYWVNNYIFSIDSKELAYGFYDQGKFQIYQPQSKKFKKWFSNTGSMVYGYEQLPEYGELLIITSSKKDILTLKSIGYNAVSPNNEGTSLPIDKYEDLNNRFDKIIIFFNNDYQGLKAAHHMSQNLGIDFIYFPMDINEKDPSDFIQIHGVDKTKETIKQLINGRN